MSEGSAGAASNDQYSLRIIRSDGSVIFVEANISRIIYNQRPATIGHITDITDRLQEENRINKAVIDAQETGADADRDGTARQCAANPGGFAAAARLCEEPASMTRQSALESAAACQIICE